MTTKHTPGPWEVDEYSQSIIWGPNGEHIADVRGFGAGLPMIPNARVLAAAPKMLEALKNIRKELQLSGNWIANDYGWPSNREAITAAIAKAEGA